MSEQWKNATCFAIKILVVCILCGTIALALYLLPKLLVLLAPFLVAAVVVLIADPISRLLVKLKMPKKLAALISMLLVIATVGSLLAFLVTQLVNELVTFGRNFPTFYETARIYLVNALEDVRSKIRLLPEGYLTSLDSVFENVLVQLGQSLSFMLTSLAEPLTKFAINSARNVPQIIIFVIITLLSTFFMLSDKTRIFGKLKQFMPEKLYFQAGQMKNRLFSALGGYVKAQLILMSITFVELFIGFLILRVDYAFLLALLICIIDAIPILGTGTVLIPWSIVALVMRDFRLGLGLLILYGVCLVVRQISEPKIIGDQIGLYPLVTLGAMYVGLRLFGLLGLIVGPVLAIIVQHLYDAGLFDSIFPHRRKAEQPAGEKGK